MKKTRFRVINGLLWFSLSLLSFYKPTIVSAETYTADSSNRDFYFVSGDEVQMSLRTYAWQYRIDSMLWVYDEQNNLITANDDYFGLDSFVQFTMLPNVTYRVRAGVCCGDPNRWYGASYVIEPSIVPINAPTTTETTTTTELTTTTTELTTTTTSTTTTVPETTTTWPTTTTTVLIPTVIVEETTTTTVPQTTTTEPVPTTLVSTTTLVPSTTTTQQTTTTVPLTTTTSSSTTTTVVAVTTTTVASNPVPEIVLAQVTTEELIEFFETLDLEQLTDEQKDELIEELSNAPDDVKKTFENTVNVFGGGFDDYTPLGSTVTVGERKVLIAATGVLFMAPTVAVSSSTSGSQSSDSRRRR